jgi:hypothetical protein
MKSTNHALKRMQQRGFSDSIVEIIMNNGHQKNERSGAISIYFGTKEYSKAMDELKKFQKLLDKAKNRKIIIKHDNIVTLYKTN